MGRLALAFLACVLAVQIAARVLQRVIPTAFFVRVALSLERPIRARLLGATVVARRVGLRPGMRVLHVGLNDPNVTDALTRTVGPLGHVDSVALESIGSREPLPIEGDCSPPRVSSDLTTLPFGDQSFDAVCIVSAFGRVPDRRRALAEMWRVLRPAGRLSASEILSDPAYVLRRTLEGWGESSGFERLEHFGNVVAYTTNFRKPLLTPS